MKSRTAFVEVSDEPLHKEVYRNEHVRVYRAILKPGDSTDFHRHSKNTLYVTIRGGNIRTKTMKGTHACPTVLSKRVSLNKRICLLFQKVFSNSLNLFNGFVFYMASERNPVIHKATASGKNSFNMDLMGIEVLLSNKMKYSVKDIYGNIEIKSDEIMACRIPLNSHQKISGENLHGDGLIIVLSGELGIKGNQECAYLKIGDLYWTGDESILEIENQGLKQMEILYVVVKK
jgi:hypothetical protein